MLINANANNSESVTDICMIHVNCPPKKAITLKFQFPAGQVCAPAAVTHFEVCLMFDPINQEIC